MSDPSRISVDLLPQGKRLEAVAGTTLRDLLEREQIEFPCGGNGRCRGCKVKVVSGALPSTPADQRLLPAAALAEGWRLACQATASSDLTLEVAQCEMSVLSDESTFQFTPRSGLGIAVDVGTTTLAAQLLDLTSGGVLGVCSSLNPQSVYGADLMTRIEASLGGANRQLTRVIREQVGKMIDDLLTNARVDSSELVEVVLVGNSVMHHLFSALPIESLARHPFEPAARSQQCFSAPELGWSIPSAAVIRFLPCLGGFVGSDILAGIFATGLHEREAPTALIDLGTNGEIVLGNRSRMLCASTAAGSAFEGARISMGMRAVTGAISQVGIDAGILRCHVLGDVPPRGVCGSGLVDAIAAGLRLELIQPAGRLAPQQQNFHLAGPVHLSQRDIREFQLAKSAISTGLLILAREWGIGVADIESVSLAGAFGNYVDIVSAQQVGLLPRAARRIIPAGNTALLGAKIALCGAAWLRADSIEFTRSIEHVSLNEHPAFQDLFVDQLRFPEPAVDFPEETATTAH